MPTTAIDLLTLRVNFASENDLVIFSHNSMPLFINQFTHAGML